MVSYFRGDNYRRNWGSDFSREPIDVYQEKERQRAADMLRQWGATGAGKGPLGQVVDNFFTSAAQYVAGEAQKAQQQKAETYGPSNAQLGAPAAQDYSLSNLPALSMPAPKKKSGGGGIFGSVFDGVKNFAEDALGVANKGAEIAGEAFNAPLKYGIMPAGEILTGQAGAAGRSGTHGEGIGGRFREVAEGLRSELTSNPLRTYGRAVKAGEQDTRELEQNGIAGFNPKVAGVPIISTAFETAANPLSYVGLGEAGAARTALKGAKLAGGAVAGGIGGSVVAKRLGVPDRFQPLAQLGGSLVGGHVAAHPEAITSLPEKVAGAAERTGVVPQGAVPGGAMVQGPEIRPVEEVPPIVTGGGVEAPSTPAAAPPPTNRTAHEGMPAQRTPDYVEPQARPYAENPIPEPTVGETPPESNVEAAAAAPATPLPKPPLNEPTEPTSPADRIVPNADATPKTEPAAPTEPPPPVEPPTGEAAPQPEEPATPTPTVDLLRGKPREQLLATAEANPSLVDRGKTAVGKARSDVRTKIVASEKNRTDQVVAELAPQQVERIRADAERAGLNVVPGEKNDWVLEGTDVPIEDVVEGTSDAGRAAYEGLNPEQRGVIDEIQRINGDWNSTIQAHGGAVPMRDTPNGNFWPRRVTGREIEGKFVEKNKTGSGPGGRRALGASRIGHRTQESVGAGQENGIQYANPWDALAGGLTNKARVAQDSYLANLVKPLAVKERPGFGITSLPGHPALTTKQFVGQTDSGAVLLADKPMAFESDVAKKLDAIFNGKDAVNIPIVKKINAVFTPLRATLDMSWSLQQGLAALEKNAIRTLRDSVKTVRSAIGDEQAYHDVIRNQEARGQQLLSDAGIDARSALDWHMQRGLHYSAEGASDEFKFPSKIEKIPVAGKLATFSNETFGRTLNADRFALANDALERAIKKGLRGGALDDAMEGAEQSVNRMTGWTSTKPGSILSHAAFAPKFFVSNVEQIAAAVTKGDLEGKLAREHLARLTAIAVGTTVAVNSLRGYKTDFDPRSANFIRMRNIGGQDISPFGTFATIIRGAAQFTQDPKEATKYFLRAKSSPAVSTIWSLVTGSNFEGQEFNPLSGPKGALNAAVQIGKESLPFSAQSAIEGAQQGGIEGAVGNTATSFLGAQSSPVTPSERRDFKRDEVAQKLFGMDYNDLRQATQKAQVNQDPGVQAAISKAQKNALTRNDGFSKSTQFNIDFQSQMGAAADALSKGQEPNGQPYTGIDYRHTYQDATAARLNKLKGAGIDYSGGDPVVGGYYDLYEKATMPDGNIDYDTLDQLQTAYEAEHPDIQARLAKSVGVNDDPTLQQLRMAQKQAQEYYNLPAFRGLSADQSDRAQQILAIADGYGGSTKTVVAQLYASGKISKSDADLAFVALRVGTNPARQQFMATHEPFAVFYGGYASGEEAARQYAQSRRSSGGGFFHTGFRG